MLGLLLFALCANAQDLSFMNPARPERALVSLEHERADADEMRLDEQRAAFSIPVWLRDKDGLALIGRGQRAALGERLQFPRSGLAIPKEFGSADFGLAYGRESENGHRIGGNATFGYAGTRLFDGDGTPIVAATLIVERKRSDHSWIYVLTYSNNRTFLNNVPLPGFAYTRSARHYTLVAGLPFLFVNWRPDPWSVSLAISPFAAGVEGGYRFWGPLQSVAGLSWSPRSYQNLVPGSDDRLIFDKKEASAGLRYVIGRQGSLSLAYVYGFDRRLLLTESISDSDPDTVRVDDGGGVQLRARLTL